MGLFLKAWPYPNFLRTGHTKSKALLPWLGRVKVLADSLQQPEEPCWAGKEPHEREVGCLEKSGRGFQDRGIPPADLEGCPGVGRAGLARRGCWMCVVHGGAILLA